jgi:hypothetical protein
MASNLKSFYRNTNISVSAPGSASWTANPSASVTTLLNNIVIANSGSSSTTYNIMIESASTYYYLVGGAAIPANDSLIIDIKQIIDPGKGVKVWSPSANVTFHFSGVEISA